VVQLERLVLLGLSLLLAAVAALLEQRQGMRLPAQQSLLELVEVVPRQLERVQAVPLAR
jgi:hypothetical protein